VYNYYLSVHNDDRKFCVVQQYLKRGPRSWRETEKQLYFFIFEKKQIKPVFFVLNKIHFLSFKQLKTQCFKHNHPAEKH